MNYPTIKKNISMILLGTLMLGISCSKINCSNFNPSLISNISELLEKIPSVNYKGVRVKRINFENGIGSASIILVHRFQFKNPYEQPLTIPKHTFELSMANEDVPLHKIKSIDKLSFVVPPNSSIISEYLDTLPLNPQNNPFKKFIGHDNYYKLTSSFTLKLNDYLNFIPFGDSTLLSPLTKDIKKKFSLSVDDSIRLPRLPYVISLGKPNIGFTGSLDSLDFSTPIGLMQPFITEFTGVGKKICENNVVDVLLPKDILCQPWLNFTLAWAQIRTAKKIKYPGNRVTGLTIIIPINIKNPNHFPIEAPEIEAQSNLGSGFSPFSFSFKAPGGSKIGGEETKTLYATTTFNWNGDNKILDFIKTGKFLKESSVLEGEIGVDLGFGLLSIPINKPLQRDD